MRESLKRATVAKSFFYASHPDRESRGIALLRDSFTRSRAFCVDLQGARLTPGDIHSDQNLIDHSLSPFMKLVSGRETAKRISLRAAGPSETAVFEELI